MTNTEGISGIEINHNTVGQYTGLTDKNGNKIFEGDIIRFDERYTGYIVYSGIFTAFVIMRYVDMLSSEFVSVLGRGYDNYKHTFISTHAPRVWGDGSPQKEG